MCGIAGIIGNLYPDKKILNIFLDSISHRGPDHRGIYHDAKMIFGMNRLSIIDLKSGNQPIQTEDGRYTIIFNGEIYNYNELKKSIGKQYSFKTNSDTEVILAGYSLFGNLFFEQLNGIYAIALWDRLEKKLTLARDKRGVKPLYYGNKENFIYFSSELKSFIDSKLFQNVDLNSLQQFLSAGYIFHNNTSMKNIKQLNPGEIIEIVGNKIINIYRSNQLVFDESKKKVIKNIPQFVKEKTIEAVNRQLISDVPVGLLLSSGIDSMSILSSIKELKKLDQLSTYTAYYPNKEFSENRLVENLAKKWNFKNFSIEITPENIFENLNKIFYTFDNLDFIPVSIVKYILSNFADNKNKVLLCGAGGDEIFCSYPTHLASHFRKKINFINTQLFKFFLKFINFKKFSGSHLDLNEKIERFKNGSLSHDKYYHLAWRYIFSLEEMKEFNFVKDVNFENIYRDQIYYHELFEGQNKLNFFSNIDLNTWLIDHALKLWDKAGMSNSIEVRVPFLDLQYLQELNHLSASERVKKIGSKQLLRDSFKDLLPKDVYKMKKKGFTVPVNDWLKYKKINKTMRELTYSLPEKFIKHNFLDKLWFNFDHSLGNQTYKIWILGCLAGWLNINSLKLDD